MTAPYKGTSGALREGGDRFSPDAIAQVFGRNIAWQAVALSVSEWPDEGADGVIDEFREARFAQADYLVAVRRAEPPYSLWRMNNNESDWRFLGHFERWPDQWTKQGLQHA